jgi:hypothetical protein
MQRTRCKSWGMTEKLKKKLDDQLGPCGIGMV